MRFNSARPAGLPAIRGRPIRLRFLDDPRALRGRMTSGGQHGRPVHAGSFLRRRVTVVDSALLDSPREFARILAHELFHFAWLRLGNDLRRDWERLLEAEMRNRASGELGWSAEYRKRALGRADRLERTRRWREYVCESFCDTAAWMLAGAGRHAEFTLQAGARRTRREWFGDFFKRGVSI